MYASLTADQDQRTSTRNKYEASIQYENGGNGIFYPAKMLNYSANGMYFETAIIHRPGDQIHIDCDFSPYAEIIEGHRAEVMWCKKIFSQGAQSHYGVGVKYFESIQ